MLLKKITCGFVVQTFDTETKKWVSQTFIAGDQCDYEDENENPIDSFDDGSYGSYLPYDMHQPCEKLVVEVRGGVVQAVYVETVSPNVFVVDWDNIDNGDNDGAYVYPGNLLEEMPYDTAQQVDKTLKLLDEIE